MVVVIAIIVVLVGFTTPAINTVLRGTNLDQASQILTSQINFARQQASTRNHSIEVRFYRYGDPDVPGESVKDPLTGHFRAMQVFEVFENLNVVPLDKIQPLPTGIIFAFNDGEKGLSTLLDSGVRGQLKRPGSEDRNAPNLPRGVENNYEYTSFRFNSDGSTNLPTRVLWYVTLISSNERLVSPEVPPANYFTLQIDPISGAIKSYRPNAG